MTREHSQYLRLKAWHPYHAGFASAAWRFLISHVNVQRYLCKAPRKCQNARAIEALMRRGMRVAKIIAVESLILRL